MPYIYDIYRYMRKNLDLLLKSMLAGVAISCGCTVFLKIGGLEGAVLFAFGLSTVVYYKLSLYTGTAGFINVRTQVPRLLFILLGNIMGCLLWAMAMRHALPTLSETATALLTKRLELDLLSSTLLAVGCGFIMTTAVNFARQGHFIPLLLGVPLFIMCGFLHSIADAFYYLMCPPQFLADHWWPVLRLYLSIVLGNFIGCNLYRMADVARDKES